MILKDYILSVFSGILLILIFPNWNVKELAWVSLVPLLFAIKDKDAHRGFLLASIAGFVFNLGLIYWVTVSMTTYGKMHLALSIIVLVLLSLYLCLFIGVPFYCSCYMQRTQGLSFTVSLPLFWTAAEYVKSWFLTGFPWENLGYSQFQALHVIQIADITGVYGISFLVVLVNGTIFSFLESRSLKKRIPYKEMSCAALALIVTFSYGQARLVTPDRQSGTSLKVALVQGNIEQDVKWEPAFLDATMNKYSRLTLETIQDKPDLVIWPEAATPFYFQSEVLYQKMVAEVMKKAGAHLLLGSPAWEREAGELKFFNSAFLVSPEGALKGRYDKIHLVPYGEYVPLRQFFPFIDKMVVGIGDFSSGTEVSTLSFPGGTFGTLICYEIIFPDLVRRFVKKGAGFLVNITNDAWFGRTSAPYQHLSMAVLRAVENRRFIARAANTGISAIIDASGRIVQQSKLFTPAYLTGIILTGEEKTFYTHYGDIFAMLCLGASLFFIANACLKTRMRKKRYDRKDT